MLLFENNFHNGVDFSNTKTSALSEENISKCIDQVIKRGDEVNNLFDATYMMFSDFKSQIKDAIETYLPNIIPNVFNLIEYCKDNNTSRDNPIDLGYSDLYAWYENIESFDCLLTKDQNCEFLILTKKAEEIYVYEVKDMYRFGKMKPSLEDFANIVVPYLRDCDKKWEEFFNAMHNDNDDLAIGEDNCPMDPIVVISYYKFEVNNETKIHKHTLLKAGFNYITDVKILNALESQIRQFAVCLLQR